MVVFGAGCGRFHQGEIRLKGGEWREGWTERGKSERNYRARERTREEALLEERME